MSATSLFITRSICLSRANSTASTYPWKVIIKVYKERSFKTRKLCDPSSAVVSKVNKFGNKSVERGWLSAELPGQSGPKVVIIFFASPLIVAYFFNCWKKYQTVSCQMGSSLIGNISNISSRRFQNSNFVRRS